MDLGNGLGFWNTMPMRRRTSIGSTLRGVEVLAVERDPPRDAGPGNQVVHPVQRHAGSCDLPQPDGPIIAVIWFFAIGMVVPRTAS